MPGVGLLLLRVAIGLAFLYFGVNHFVSFPETRILTLGVAALSSMCGLSLLFGLLNQLACSLAALIGLGVGLALIPVPVLNVPASARISAVFTAVIAIALLCLGPGAYSLDARRHGRREIIIPPRSRSSDDSAL